MAVGGTAIASSEGVNWAASTLLVALLSTAGAVSAAPELTELREAALRSRQQVQELKLRQAKLADELDQLGGKIAGLKQQHRTSLPPAGELSRSLRRSQELSAELTKVAQALSKEELNLQRTHQALAAALSEHVRRLAGQWEGSARTERKHLLSEMRSLRAEREQVRALLPDGPTPLTASGPTPVNREDLLEQADALRDSEDKVQQQIRSLETRIAEARQERELDRKVKEFLREESLFDEQDRRFRLRAGETPVLVGGNGASGTPAANPPPGSGGPVAPGQTPGSERTPTSQPSSGQSVIPDRGAHKSRPVDGNGQVTGRSDPESVESLEAQREQLKSLARQLEQTAKRAESKARELP